MNYAVLLAAGRGLRLESSTIKSLLIIHKKPLFLYSLNTFIRNKRIDQIIVVVPKDHISQFKKYLGSPIYKHVHLVTGDNQYRHLSLANAIAFLKSTFNMKPSDVIVTHDIARINVTSEIINNNIAVAARTGYASTVLSLHDSLCEITNTAKYISRDNKFIVQTPQSFQYKHWKINNKNKNITDLFSYLNVSIKNINLVRGDLLNFKITTKQDLLILKQIQLP